jgi:hypothetical protein
MRRLLWVLALAVAFPSSLAAHGGGLDSLGCHHNRKLGGYHCHREPLAGQSFASKAQAEQALAAKRANSPSSQANGSPTAGNPDVRVWVNTRSGVYHCPGTHWYGATQQGGYMSQREAQKAGNRPAYGKLCQ